MNAERQSEIADIRKKLFEEAMTRYGFTPDQVKQILLKHGYGGFRPSMYDVYMTVLKAEKLSEVAKQQKEYELDAQLADPAAAVEQVPLLQTKFDPIPCPVCGSPTSGDYHWYGRQTHKPGWRCSKGGLAHFLWAKANECRRAQGLSPLPWEKFSAEKADLTVPSYRTT